MVELLPSCDVVPALLLHAQGAPELVAASAVPAVVVGAFVRSMRKPPVAGTIACARGAGPRRRTIASIEATAVAVEPTPKPTRPATITAAS